jgi:putative ABC transport system permease protein
MSIVLKTSPDPVGYAQLVRSTVTAIDRNQPVSRIRSMDAIVWHSIARQRFTMYLIALFAGLALALSLAGLYAVVSHSVEQRIREMGVRLALGASPSQLMRLVLVESLRLVGAGIAVGIVVALGATQFMKTLLFGVHASDPLTFVLVPLLLLAAATAGCLVPAVRAMRIDRRAARRLAGSPTSPTVTPASRSWPKEASEYWRSSRTEAGIHRDSIAKRRFLSRGSNSF